MKMTGLTTREAKEASLRGARIAREEWKKYPSEAPEYAEVSKGLGYRVWINFFADGVRIGQRNIEYLGEYDDWYIVTDKTDGVKWPKIGDVVKYVPECSGIASKEFRELVDGRIVNAIVTFAVGEWVTLYTAYPLTEIEAATGHEKSKFSATKEPGTWHWPEPETASESAHVEYKTVYPMPTPEEIERRLNATIKRNVWLVGIGDSQDGLIPMGIYTTEERAVQACKDESYFIMEAELNKGMISDSTRCPKQEKPAELISYGNAMVSVENGAEVRRTAWEHTDKVYKSGEGRVMSNKHTVTGYYMPTMDDMSAHDWYISRKPDAKEADK